MLSPSNDAGSLCANQTQTHHRWTVIEVNQQCLITCRMAILTPSSNPSGYFFFFQSWEDSAKDTSCIPSLIKRLWYRLTFNICQTGNLIHILLHEGFRAKRGSYTSVAVTIGVSKLWEIEDTECTCGHITNLYDSVCQSRAAKANQQSTLLRLGFETKPFSSVFAALCAPSRRVLGPKLLNPPLDGPSVCGHQVH